MDAVMLEKEQFEELSLKLDEIEKIIKERLEKEDTKLEQFLGVDFRGLIPTTEELISIGAGAIGLHYIDKLSEFASKWLGFLGDWATVVGAYLMYKWGSAIHPAISKVGFGWLIAEVEKLLAPHLPSSPSKVEKMLEKDIDINQLAYNYAGVR